MMFASAALRRNCRASFLATNAAPVIAPVLLGCGLALSMAPPAQAAAAMEVHDLHHVQVPEAAVRRIVDDPVPHVRMQRSDGKIVWLSDELDDGRPVVLDFIYTTCTTICATSSRTLEALQDRLGTERERVHLVSVSIDPEEDTPQRLTEYSRRFDAGPQWQFYTGTVDASLTVQRALRVYRGSKMTHDPVTLVRIAPGKPWVRFEGFATPKELLSELHTPVASR